MPQELKSEAPDPPGSTDPPRRSLPRRLLNRMEIDQAVFFAIAARVWQLLAGPVTMLLIVAYFTAEIQGYYYVFGSLLALQLFVELGFQFIIIYVASHEWARLELDESGAITGDSAALSRLSSLAHLAFKWYAAASLLFVAVVSVVGFVFLSGSSDASIEWRDPWFALVVLTGLSLWILPLIALLEGCNQVATVNRYRLLQAVTGNIVVWTAILSRAELWTAVAAAGVRLFWECYLVMVRYRRFFAALLAKPPGPKIEWLTEVWPLQWRFGVQGTFTYFATALFTPVMFYYHEPAVAGRMGMTWTLLAILQSIAIAWVQTRAPRFGILAVQRDYAELDRIFRRVTAISAVVLAVGGFAFWLGVYALHLIKEGGSYAAAFLPMSLPALAERISTRLLPPDATAVFVAAVVLFHFPQCQALYIRVHKTDPFVVLSISSNICIGLLVWLLGWRFGPLGAAWGYLAVIALIVVPAYHMMWRRFRRERR